MDQASEFQTANDPESTDSISADQDLQLLNEEEGQGEPAALDFGENDIESRYQGLHQLDILLEDEKTRASISYFLPESLLELQTIGLDVAILAANGTLTTLANLIPARVSIRPSGLTNDLILLVEPRPVEKGQISLKVVPFLKRIPAISLTEKQKKATELGTPFWMFKRVVDPVTSEEFASRYQELWMALTNTFRLDRPIFEEIIRCILHEPTLVHEAVVDQSWTKESLEDFSLILEEHFPLQVAFFTGIGFLFYPMTQLAHFSAWQKLVTQPAAID